MLRIQSVYLLLVDEPGARRRCPSPVDESSPCQIQSMYLLCVDALSPVNRLAHPVASCTVVHPFDHNKGVVRWNMARKNGTCYPRHV